jgi:hypothetical protein
MSKIIRIILLALVISVPYILARATAGVIPMLLEEIIVLAVPPAILVSLQIKCLLILIAN